MSAPEPPYGSLPGPIPPYVPGQPASRNHSGATTAMVLGIVGLVALPLGLATYVGFLGAICSPFAIWFGVKAGREIDASPYGWSNRGMATAGFWMGIVGLVLNVIAVLALVALVALFVAVLAGTSA